MLLTLALSAVMMAGLFLMLWGAVGFVQEKRLFGSAPKEALAVMTPKEERFRGQHLLGWSMLILSLALMVGALAYGGYDGIQNGFTYVQFFGRFAAMLLLLKAYDILFFDWYLLCRSGFYAHYFPEVKDIFRPEIFGYNKKSHAVQILLMVLASLLMAGICCIL